MKYIDEFRNKNLIRRAADKIREIMPQEEINIMEVCGTHTQSFFRFALGQFLPENLRLISGPGCPVCVSPQEYIDRAIELSRDKDNIILSFGDMLRVPGGRSTLEKERAKGGAIRVVYSALDSLLIARKNPHKRVIFLAVGFETTAPTIGLAVLLTKKENLRNLLFFSSLKLIPPAMEYLVQDRRLRLSGFLCPGHVSAIIGTQPYGIIAEKYGIGCCIAGFEPLDIMEGIYFLIRQTVIKRPRVDNQYMRVVTKQGNIRAQKIIRRVFKSTDSAWRGLGGIPRSGLKIKDEFSRFDAEKVLGIKRGTRYAVRRTPCKCGEVLKGLISPLECPSFMKACRPENPLGPCMVSNEGACNAYSRYK